MAAPPVHRPLRTWIRDNLAAGVIAAVPLVVVYWVVDKVILSMDGVLRFLPTGVREATWHPPWLPGPVRLLETPGLGFFASALLLILIGAVVRGFIGQRLARWIIDPLRRTPILGTIYTATRQLLETVFSNQAQSFQRVVLVQFPARGTWALGFVTARTWDGASEATGVSLFSVFVPTTPNPTSGFFVMVDERELIPMEMTVEQAFQTIMSAGIIQPPNGRKLETDIGSMTLEVPAEPPRT